MDKLLFEAKIQVESHVVKKNNRPIWRNRLGKSNKLIQAELHLTQELKKLKKDKPIRQPVRAELKFYFLKDNYFTKKGNINKKLPDLSNLYQLVEDCLQSGKNGSGIIEDDHYVASHDGSRRCWTTESKPYLLIKIYEFNEV